MPAITDIGPWSEIKIEIIKKYAKAYSVILDKKPYLKHHYIDAFAGAGKHISRTTGEFVSGSSRSALEVEPQFEHYYFIDIDSSKTNLLQELESMRPGRVSVIPGDCNEILLDKILPLMTYKSYSRALCLLDPYGLHLDWRLIEKCGQLKTIDLFLNFPVMDMNMNVLWNNPEKVTPEQSKRMTRFWGDETWKEVAYSSDGLLFKDIKEKVPNDVIVDSFVNRLRNVAEFGNVVEPLPMRNKTNSVVYYLFFASQNKTANNIVNDIFNKYR